MRSNFFFNINCIRKATISYFQQAYHVISILKTVSYLYSYLILIDIDREMITF